MLGFHGIGETAINEFPPEWVLVGPKTASLILVPVYRVASSAKPVYVLQQKIVPK